MKVFNTLASLFIIRAFAVASKVTVATVAGDAAQNPDGVLFSDAIRTVYSKEIEYKALPIMRFFQFAEVKTEFGVEPGLTISMLTYDNLALGGKLVEMTNMTTQALSGSMESITVSEYGNAVSMSELLIQSSFDDVMSRASTLLGRDYAMVLDTELRDAALSGTNVIYADKANGTANIQRSELDAESTFKVSTVKDALEILSTKNAPKNTVSNSWMCFLHPHQARAIRDDSAWINASNYGAPQLMFNGEIGRIDDVRFVETTLMSNGAAAATDPGYDATLVKGAVGASAATHTYQAVIFGDAYYAAAFSLPVEIRDNGVEDFGRKRSIAWYSIFGVAKLHNDYGVVIETA